MPMPSKQSSLSSSSRPSSIVERLTIPGTQIPASRRHPPHRPLEAVELLPLVVLHPRRWLHQLLSFLFSCFGEGDTRDQTDFVQVFSVFLILIISYVEAAFDDEVLH